MDESTLLYQEGASDGDADGRQVVLQLPEGCDAAEGVIMQIEGDKIHIITQGGQLGDNPLGIAMESIMQVQQQQEEEAGTADPGPQLPLAGADGEELRVTDGEDEDEEEIEELEVEDGEVGGQMKADNQLEMEAEPEEECFVCSGPCRQPARLLLTRAAGSGAPLAERLASLLPLRLHCSASDGVCSGCRQLIEQADQHHTQLKALELRVRQLFHLEEKLEEEEQRREQEQEAARLRQETLARRREQERRRQLEQQKEQERRQRKIQRQLRAGEAAARAAAEGSAEPFPFAADDDFDSSDEMPTAAAGAETAPPPPPPPPPPPADDVTDEDWTPRKRYSSRRRRQPRRPWSPTDHDSGSVREETEGMEAERAAAAAAGTEGVGTERRAGEMVTEPAITAGEDQDQEAQDQPDQTSGSRDPDNVPTTTIEFVSFNTPRRRGRRQHRLLNVDEGGSRGRRRAWNSGQPSFYCRRCDTSFDNSSSLVEHITSSHRRPWCRRCRSEFDSPGLLSQHRRHCRSQCSLCGRRPANMAQHLRRQHPGLTPPPEGTGERRGAAGAEDGDETRGPRHGPRRSTSSSAAAAAAPPTVIEFRDVSTLREQVKNVKTPRFSLKFRRASTSDLEKIQHLSVGDKRPAAAGAGAGAGAGSRSDTTRPHTCLRCGQHLGSLRDQIEHLHTVHKGKSWCRRCKSEFPSKQANLAHKPECKRLNTEGDCPQCGKHVKNLKIHLKTHEVSGKRRRESVVGPDGKLVSASLAGGECHICKKYIPHRLKRHVASHVQHPCPICKKLFSREDVIAGHIKRVHMKERPHICNHCGKGFVSLYSMQRHEMIHTNSYRFYCQECGDGFRQKQQLTTHMRHKHGVVEIEFEDVRESAILGAITDGTVTTELRFYCQECGSGFHSRRQLTAHMRNKHGVANVVFEDVQLHVAGPIEHLEAVTVAEEGVETDAAAAVGQLTEQGTDPTETGAASVDRQAWWDPDQNTAY